MTLFRFRMMFRSTLFVCLLLLSFVSKAQEMLKLRPSPLAIAAVRYQDHYVKVTYSQPQKTNRKIFGDLVPFGKVWRTGANEATEGSEENTSELQSLMRISYAVFCL